MTGLATAAHEQPVYFPADVNTLFGVFTRPTRASNGMGVILMEGGSPSMVSFQRNRLAVRMARQLAALGYHVLRFDYHGVGDSSGRVEVFRLDRPFEGDLAAAARWMRQQGFARLVVIGSCFGARSALAAAADLEGLESLAMIAMSIADDIGLVRVDEFSVGHYVKRGLRPDKLKGLLDPSMRRVYGRVIRRKLKAVAARLRQRLTSRQPLDPTVISPRVFGHVRRAAELGVHLLFVYGEQDAFYRDFQRARQGPFGRLLERYADRITVSCETAAEVHGFTSVSVQEHAVEQVVQWVARRGAATGAVARPAAG